MINQFFFFKVGSADGNRLQTDLLGNKGASLAELAVLGMPVPPGFTIPTTFCREFFSNGSKFTPEFTEAVKGAVLNLEGTVGKQFGSLDNPLLLSVRSGAPISMPGMLETVLNIGMNDALVEPLISATQNPFFVYDTYRRLLEMYLHAVCGLSALAIDGIGNEIRELRNIPFEEQLDVEGCKEVILKLKDLHLKKTDTYFPQDPYEQLWNTIAAVFNSWNCPRAKKYRAINNISETIGTAANICTMVFGNKDSNSASGVCFSRDPSTGKKTLFGEYLLNAQGEDVVSGLRTPKPLHELLLDLPLAYEELVNLTSSLERHFREIQDIEFTIEAGKLWILQTRKGRCSSQAAFKISIDMIFEKIISIKEAVARVEPSDFEKILLPGLDPRAHKQVIGKGLATSPGAASGRIVFSALEAEKAKIKGEDVILVREETSPDDIGGIHAANGLLTTRGGMTSHAAIVARQMGKCCVAGCGNIQVLQRKRVLRAGNLELTDNDIITIDGSTGEVLLGRVATRETAVTPDVLTFIAWAASINSVCIKANADTLQEALYARKMGAQGIGLCRTEKVFFERQTLPFLWQALLSNSPSERQEGIASLKLKQVQAVREILEAMEGFEVAIRLFDHPLIEFMPNSESDLELASATLHVKKEVLSTRLHGLIQANPALGHRGCRLGIAYPEIYDMQIQAIVEATNSLTAEGKDVRPQIMLPFVSTIGEVVWARKRFGNLLSASTNGRNIELGVMIETPRSALIAGELAKHADFLCIGTYDLTQLTYGISRDDAAPFLRIYKQEGIMHDDPLSVLDEAGVGFLIKRACDLAKAQNPKMSIGLCSEHHFESAKFLFDGSMGLSFISCSAFNVPIAILQAARIGS